MTKITIDSSTVKKAMEAMLYFPGDISDEMFESIRALRTALAQPQEPDSWGAGYEAGYAAGVAEHPAQPVQEPCNKSCAPGYCYCAAQEAQPAQDTDCQAQGICQRSGYSIK